MREHFAPLSLVDQSTWDWQYAEHEDRLETSARPETDRADRTRARATATPTAGGDPLRHARARVHRLSDFRRDELRAQTALRPDPSNNVHVLRPNRCSPGTWPPEAA